MAGCRITIAIAVVAFFAGGCENFFTYGKQSRARGLDYLKTDQYAEAKGAFRDAVRQNPRDYQSYHYLGVLDAREKAYSSAIGNFRTSLNVQRTDEEGRENLAFRLKTIDELAKVLSQSDPRDMEINKLEREAKTSSTGDEYLALAKAFAYRGDADSAIVAYEQAVRQAPRTFYVAKDQGLYLEKVGQRALAESALRRAYRLNDRDPDVDAALRRLGVVPGPALKEESELARPALPKGPLPDLTPRPSTPTPTPTPSPSPAD